MEGFTGNKNVKPYALLARYYDELLMDREAFSYWLNFIELEPFSTCLELASGTGVIAGILKEKGVQITASDLSSEMKDASKENFDGEYLILDMTDYRLDKKYDLIICFVDSINYLKVEQLDGFFSCTYEHLNPKGRLIFDSHNPMRIKEFEEEYIEEGRMEDGTPYQWVITSDSLDQSLQEHFTFYMEDVMIQEHHFQNVFNPELLKKKMENSGFKAQVIEDFIPEEKMLFIGRKL